jgi:hypothetical protein
MPLRVKLKTLQPGEYLITCDVSDNDAFLAHDEVHDLHWYDTRDTSVMRPQ